MLLFLIVGEAPLLLAFLLVVMVYLAFIEVRNRPLSWQGKLWWCLLVFLTNFPGLIVLRVYFYTQDRKRASA